jgi:hypothetical protein
VTAVSVGKMSWSLVDGTITVVGTSLVNKTLQKVVDDYEIIIVDGIIDQSRRVWKSFDVA